VRSMVIYVFSVESYRQKERKRETKLWSIKIVEAKAY
jgi:hypothetical protein